MDPRLTKQGIAPSALVLPVPFPAEPYPADDTTAPTEIPLGSRHLVGRLFERTIAGPIVRDVVAGDAIGSRFGYSSLDDAQDAVRELTSAPGHGAAVLYEYRRRFYARAALVAPTELGGSAVGVVREPLSMMLVHGIESGGEGSIPGGTPTMGGGSAAAPVGSNAATLRPLHLSPAALHRKDAGYAIQFFHTAARGIVDGQWALGQALKPQGQWTGRLGVAAQA